MARAASEKHRRLAKLPFEEALAIFAPEGADAKTRDKLHKIRCYYRNRDRYNKQRNKRYREQQGGTSADAEVMTAAGERTMTQVIAVPVPQSAGAYVHLWRQNKSAPLHAIGFELFQNGSKTVEVEPVHTIGWTAPQVKQYMRDVLKALSQHVGREITKFEAQVEHDPKGCAIAGCPLKGG